jgi:TorA maturation chaperone TorD
MAVANGAGAEPKRQSAQARSVGSGPETESVIVAVDLLAHFWSRPVTDEVASWTEARDIEVETNRRISSDPVREPVRLPDPEEALGLLDEYERLFVGPGQVPCPPYESFWREDVPVDIRRTLMGPCTADLRRIYNELGLQVSARSGELPDHIAIELEALAYALSLEETDAVACQLFEGHLVQWLPRLCRAVAHEAEEDFYRNLAVLTLDWLAAIKSYFIVLDMG